MRTVDFLVVVLTSFSPALGRQNEAGKTENVIVVTLDGFRPQEMFGGADETLLDREGGGVRDVPALKERFWRDSPEERRKTLLPFLWETVAVKGQIFGDPSRGAPVTLTNGLKFSYPGYNEMFCGFGRPSGRLLGSPVPEPWQDGLPVEALRNDDPPASAGASPRAPALPGRGGRSLLWKRDPRGGVGIA